MRRLVFVGFEGGTCTTLAHPLEVFSQALNLPQNGAQTEHPFRIDIVTPTDEPFNRVGFFTLEPTVSMGEAGGR
jgi:hypothetical protein